MLAAGPLRGIPRAALVALALVSACGGAPADRCGAPPPQTVLTHEQYQQSIDAVLASEDATAASRSFSAAVTADHDKDACSDEVHGLADRLDALLRRVQDLQAPDDAAAEQRQFLEAAKESVRLVRAAAEDVDAGDLRCGQAVNRRIYGLPSTARAEAALAALKEHGYRVFGE